MYIISKDEELGPQKLGKIISEWKTKEYPQLLKLRNYYDGKQDIMNKVPTDTGKPCNRVVVNYCYSIVENYAGYMTGKAIQYNGEQFDRVLDVLRYNDVNSEDAELLRHALIYGMAFEVCYVDEDGETRFRLLDPRECIPVYSNTLDEELLYVIRLWRDDTVDDAKNIVEVYGRYWTRVFRSGEGFSSFQFIDERPNIFEQVPVTVFTLNEDRMGVFAQIISLQDSYNKLISDEVDNSDAFADAYLVLKGCGAEDEDLERMKQNRVLEMDTDCDASYLTKQGGMNADMLDLINEQIHKISNSPDFSDEKFMSQSGIAMRYKLVGFENEASAIETNMRKALTKRIELISEVLSLTGDEVWRDASISFTRNLPVNLDESAQVVNQLRGLVSDETLLTLLPFVTDVKEELKRIKAEQEAKYSLYGGTTWEETTGETET